MAIIDYLILATFGVPFVIVWILLVRASVRGGCGTASCRIVAPERDENEQDPNDG